MMNRSDGENDRQQEQEQANADELELRPPPNPPRPRALWVLGGFVMMFCGAILVAGIALAAVGVVMGLLGLGMVVAAFVSEDGQGLRCQRFEEVADEDGAVRLDELARPKKLQEPEDLDDEGRGAIKRALKALLAR